MEFVSGVSSNELHKLVSGSKTVWEIPFASGHEEITINDSVLLIAGATKARFSVLSVHVDTDMNGSKVTKFTLQYAVS